MRTGMLTQVAKDRWVWAGLAAVTILGFLASLVSGEWWAAIGWFNAILGFGLLAYMGHDARKRS
jgi:hypothetical protein